MAKRQRTHLFGYKLILTSIIMLGLAGYASAQPITTLPDNPFIEDFGQTAFTQHSVSNFTVHYDVNAGNFIALRWEGWSTRDASHIDEFVFGLLGDPNYVRVKFEDMGGGGTASIHDTDFILSNTVQYLTIPASEITINLEELRVIVFETDAGLAGVGNEVGDFMVYVDGLEFEEESSPVPSVALNATDASIAEITTLPNNPLAQDLHGTEFTIHSSTNVSFEYDVNAQSPMGIMIRWDGWASQNLSSITQFVFGVQGDAEVIQVTFEHDGSPHSVINLLDVSSETYQHWHIADSQINDPADIKVIKFEVWKDLVGDGNDTGEVMICVGGLEEPPEPAPEIGPVAPAVAPLTILPNEPGIQDLGQTDVDLLSSTNILVEYGFPGDAYQGVTVRWTSEFLVQDLSAITQFVFGVRGTIGKLQVEFEHGEGPRSTVILTNVTTSYQHWLIDDDLIRDLEDIKNINFLVTADMVGGNPEGEFHVFVGGLDYTPPPVVDDVYPEFDTDTPITILPGNPALYDVWNEVAVNPISPTNFMVEYNFENPGDWNAIGARWSSGFDPYDLSSITQFVFGVKGSPKAIMVEFENAVGQKTIFNLLNVSGALLQHWHIDASTIEGLDEIVIVTFAVNEDLAENTEGSFEVRVGGLDYVTPPEDIGPTPPGTSPITVLPGNPPLDAQGDTVLNQHSSTNFTVVYDFGERWDGGAYVLWDPPTNLTDIAEFVFGVRGDPDTVRVEFEHSTGRTRFNLTGVTDALQHWHIDASKIDNLDDIKAIVFLVNEDIVGEDGAGEFEVRVGGLQFTPPPPDPVDPSTAELTVLPGSPEIFGMVDTDFEQHSSTNFTVIYDLIEGEQWGGVYVGWADPTNLTGFSEFVFGAMGDPEIITIEFEPAEGDRTAIQLQGVTNQLQYWIIDAELIGGLDNIVAISIVVNDYLAGDAQVGTFEFHVGGLAYTPPPPDPVDPSTAEITILPGNPDLGGFAGGEVVPHSSTNFTLTYEISGDPDFAGASIQWAAPFDLTSIEEFVFGLMGDPNSVRVEFKADGDVTTHVILNGVAENLQYWIIDAAHIAGLDQIVEIVFVVDQGLAGEGNYEGTLEVHVGLEDDEPPPAEDPEFDLIRLSPDRTEIVARILESEMGVTYVLQYTTDLTEEPEVIWQTADTKSGNGDELELIDDELGTVGDPVRIYRVIVQ